MTWQRALKQEVCLLPREEIEGAGRPFTLARSGQTSSRERRSPATVGQKIHVPLGLESAPIRKSSSPRRGKLPISRPMPQISGTPSTVYWLCRGPSRVQQA